MRHNKTGYVGLIAYDPFCVVVVGILLSSHYTEAFTDYQL